MKNGLGWDVNSPTYPSGTLPREVSARLSTDRFAERMNGWMVNGLYNGLADKNGRIARRMETGLKQSSLFISLAMLESSNEKIQIFSGKTQSRVP